MEREYPWTAAWCPRSRLSASHAAEEFYDEQQDQAADTKPADAKRQS